MSLRKGCGQFSGFALHAHPDSCAQIRGACRLPRACSRQVRVNLCGFLPNSVIRWHPWRTSLQLAVVVSSRPPPALGRRVRGRTLARRHPERRLAAAEPGQRAQGVVAMNVIAPLGFPALDESIRGCSAGNAGARCLRLHGRPGIAPPAGPPASPPRDRTPVGYGTA